MAWQPATIRPVFRRWGVDSAAVSQTQLTSTQTRIAVVFMIPRSGPIDKLAFCISRVTTAQDLRIGLYTVDSSGNPTTTTYGGSSTATLPAAQVSAGIKEVRLTTPATATARDIVAFVVEWAGTAGDVTLRYQALSSTFPYHDRYASGAWTKGIDYVIQSLIGYSDGSYEIAGNPVVSDSYVNFNMNGSPDERGNLFTFPFGVRFSQIEFMTCDGGAPYDVVVYVGASSYPVSVPTYAPSHTFRGKLVSLQNVIEVPANTPFRIVVKPTSTTNVLDYWYNSFSSSGHKEAWLGKGMGSWVQYTYRTDGGTWQEDPLAFHAIQPNITEIDVGGGTPFMPGYHIIT